MRAPPPADLHDPIRIAHRAWTCPHELVRTIEKSWPLAALVSQPVECTSTMFEDRSLKIDLCALALLALFVFLGLALWTYNASDPPSTLVWPASDVVHNACG